MSTRKQKGGDMTTLLATTAIGATILWGANKLMNPTTGANGQTNGTRRLSRSLRNRTARRSAHGSAPGSSRGRTPGSSRGRTPGSSRGPRPETVNVELTENSNNKGKQLVVKPKIVSREESTSGKTYNLDENAI